MTENSSLREKLKTLEANDEHIKARLRTITKDLKLGLWEWDEIENRAYNYSEELAEIFGLSLEEMNRQYQTFDDFAKIVHPNDLPEFKKNIAMSTADSLKFRPGSSYEFRIIKPDGEICYLRETEHALVNAGGLVVSTYGILQDVTEFKLTMKALQQSEENYSSLFFHLPLGVQEEDYSAVKKGIDELRQKGIVNFKAYWQDSPDLLLGLVKQIRCIKVNEAMLNLHGANSAEEFIEEEEDVNKWWDEGWAEFFSDEFSTFAEGSAKYHEAERVDTRIDGSRIETRSIARLVTGSEQNWGRVITIHEDITDRKKNEATLIEAKLVAEKANLAKSEFLSNMRHELRTPLNAILGFSQLFEYDQSLLEHQRSNALEINRAGKHLMAIIDEVLDLARIESGSIALLVEPVSLLEIIYQCLAWVAEMAKSHGISVEFDPVLFTDILVIADPIRLKQVFLNLLTNAIKYNRPNGTISVIRDISRTDVLCIGISDTGQGMTESHLGDLFKPFNRLGAEKSSVQGTGIGLVITKQLVELMRGSMRVDSSPGKGSTFWVELIEMDRIAPIEKKALHSLDDYLIEAETTKPSILVAEDNQVNQALMAAQLDIIGYEADYAENGVEALKLWREGDYNLLLTDIRMPKMDGYELIQAARSEDRNRGRISAIIAVSANAVESDAQRCFEAGVDDVLLKPVELEQLREVLKKWTSKNSGVDIDVTNESFEVEDDNIREDNDNIDQPNPIDLLVLAQSVGPKTAVHQELLTSFVDELPAAMNAIRNAISWHSNHKLSAAAHKLKSSARSMGAILMGDICHALEKAGNEDEWQGIEQQLAKLEICQQRVIAFIDDFCRQQLDVELVDKLETELEVAVSNLSVLVVDDDYVIHRVTTVILNDLGIHKVQNALSGPLALETIQRDAGLIDVVIFDLNMPDMDGIECMRHLAKLEFKGALIITSGEDARILRTVEKLAIEHELQVLGVLKKPITPVKLYKLLEVLDQVKTEGTLIKSDVIFVEELTLAIQCGQMVTYFQPKVDLQTSQVVGMEVLVRWDHPQKGIIMPGAFINLAEESGLISELTRVICKKAMEQAAVLRARGFELNIAINISVDTLHDLHWPDLMAAQIVETGIPASSITFEITESRLMEHISVALEILSRLSLKRFNLSIDDFGTGYSSMEQLQRIPFSELKIDRAFVSGAAVDDSALAILESSVLLANKLGMTVVAEGVETQREWDLMVKLGCDQVQGYFISKPMPFDQVINWLTQWQASHD